VSFILPYSAIFVQINVVINSSRWSHWVDNIGGVMRIKRKPAKSRLWDKQD